ncbi:cytochrome c oxidase assembly factor 5 isoform X1 [Caloenas nicobarica]|uniref:cytochrome c oxidase assembly factor 5 isoform X1 n=1 Tax=Caloenas nicobarica TaxID=187106 RepID=UPI0032B71970
MPKYYEEKVEDGRACGGVREDLRQCLLESACVLQENKSPKQCLREGHCRSLQVTFFACKRSMIGYLHSEEFSRDQSMFFCCTGKEFAISFQ